MAFINIGFNDIETSELCAAAFRGDLAQVEKLATDRHQVELIDSEGKSALFYSLYAGHANCCLALIQAGARLAESEMAWSLVRGVQMQSIELVTKILNLGSQINSKSGEWTALTAAASNSDCNMISFLISKGADPSQIGVNDLPPLHISVLRHDVESIRCLLENGASINQLDVNGQSPLRALLISQNANFSKRDRKELMSSLKLKGAKFIPALTFIERLSLVL